jgi:hypothetical protein
MLKLLTSMSPFIAAICSKDTPPEDAGHATLARGGSLNQLLSNLNSAAAAIIVECLSTNVNLSQARWPATRSTLSPSEKGQNQNQNAASYMKLAKLGGGNGRLAHRRALVVQVSVMKGSLAVTVDDGQLQGLSAGLTGRCQCVDEAHVTYGIRHDGLWSR